MNRPPRSGSRMGGLGGRGCRPHGQAGQPAGQFRGIERDRVVARVAQVGDEILKMLGRIFLRMSDQVGDLFQPPDPPDILGRGRGPPAARAPRVRHVGVEWHDLLDFDPVPPVVAEVVDVPQRGPLGAQDPAEVGLLLVGDGRLPETAAAGGFGIAPLAAALVVETMKVIALPAERRLDDVVQEPQARGGRNLEPPPQRRRCSLQADLQLMNGWGICTWHRAKLPIRTGE